MKKSKACALALVCGAVCSALLCSCTSNSTAVNGSAPTSEKVADSSASAAGSAASSYGDDEIVERTYTLQNATDTTITALYVYKSAGEEKGENLVPDGMAPGAQIQVDVDGYYLHTTNETLYTVEFVADGETYSFATLHVEDLFEVLYLVGNTVDAQTGATPVAFADPSAA